MAVLVVVPTALTELNVKQQKALNTQGKIILGVRICSVCLARASQ